MTRFQRQALAICALLFAFSATACGGGSATAAPTLLTNPSQIVTLSFASLEASTTLHMDATISGSVKAGALGALTGAGAISLLGDLKLDGSTLVGDVDLARQALHLTAAFPSLFGSGAEVIVVEGYAYSKTKTPLSAADEKYKKLKVAAFLPAPSAALPALSAAPEATFSFVDLLHQFDSQVGSAAATAVLVGQETVDGRSAYHLVVNVPVDVVSQAIAVAGVTLPGGMSFDVTPVDYWVYDDGLAPARLQLNVSSSTIGNIAVSLTFTRYNQRVIIQAPPDDQVADG
jgi:hypothetical protein